MIKNLTERLFFCGFMGAGKSTLGKALAEQLDLTFLDLDTYIEEQSGKSIPEIFKEEGESAFRKWERSSILELIRNFRGVISLGGGSLQNQHLVDHIKLNGLLIFIETPFSIILKRISKETNRPLLLNDDGSIKNEDKLKEELSSLYEERLPFYEQAEVTIGQRKNESTAHMVERLIKKIRNHVAHY